MRMNPVVKIRQGELRGSLAGGVQSFKSVPYAAPPFGVNRLRPPQPVLPWDGVRDALDFGPWAPQLAPPPGGEAFYPSDPPVRGEDCLTLNVWTPDVGSAGLPVMVWIHPSMFELGSGAQYDGSHFARDGVVCVTINYRLGAEGFLYLDDGTPNLGLLDQIAALEWVQENISAFGGVGQPCASTSRPRSWTIPGPPSRPCGGAFAEPRQAGDRTVRQEEGGRSCPRGAVGLFGAPFVRSKLGAGAWPWRRRQPGRNVRRWAPCR
jgi:hypothetical protein